MNFPKYRISTTKVSHGRARVETKVLLHFNCSYGNDLSIEERIGKKIPIFSHLFSPNIKSSGKYVLIFGLGETFFLIFSTGGGGYQSENCLIKTKCEHFFFVAQNPNFRSI